MEDRALASKPIDTDTLPMPQIQKHNFIFIVTGLALAAALAAAAMRPSDSSEHTTSDVVKKTIESRVTALGTLQPRYYVDVGAQASGQIIKLHKEPGDAVEKGQLLVEIDPSTQQPNVDAARYSIDILKAQLEEQQAQYRLAEKRHQRQQELTTTGVSSDELLETAIADLHSTRARIAGLQAQIKQAEATLRSHQAELSYTRIYAPASGTVVAVDARVGQTLNAQQQTPLILRIAELSSMTVWAEVSEADIGRIKTGMAAYFTTLSGDGRHWRGTVRQILPMPPQQLGITPNERSLPGKSGKVVMYTVLFDVDNEDRALMAEMTTQIFFIAEHAENTLSIPIAALQNTDSDSEEVLVVADNQLIPRNIRTGIHDGQYIEVLAGLEEGEQVLIGPPVFDK